MLLYCPYLTRVSKVALAAAERQNCTGALPKAGLHRGCLKGDCDRLSRWCGAVHMWI